MIEELRERLPEELVWNVLKFTTHPIAEMLKPACEEFAYVRCDFQFNRWLICHSYVERKYPNTCYKCGVYLYNSNLSVRCNANCTSCYDKQQQYLTAKHNYSDSDSDSDSD